MPSVITPSLAATARANFSIFCGPQGQVGDRFRAVQLTAVSTAYRRFIVAVAASLFFRGAPPAIHELGRITQTAGTALQEVGVEREDHVGLVEIVNRIDRFAEGHWEPVPGRVVLHRLVDVPFRLAASPSTGLRSARASVGETMVSVNQAESGAAALTRLLHGVANGSQGFGPRVALLPNFCNRLCAVGIVERQYRRPGGRCRWPPRLAGWSGLPSTFVGRPV